MERESWGWGLLYGEWVQVHALARARALVHALVRAWVLALAWALAPVLGAFVVCADVVSDDASVVSVAPCS